MPLMPLRDHRLSWDQRKTLYERLVSRASLLRGETGTAELREIDEAVKRLDSAAYGSCVDCRAPIAWDRLLATPQLQRCTRCEAAAGRAAGTPALPR
jgi:RNA polymerase-binding transcription factor DksA